MSRPPLEVADIVRAAGTKYIPGYVVLHITVVMLA